MSSPSPSSPSSSSSPVCLPPLRDALESFVLYETRSHFYLVGADRREQRYQFIKIDRNEPRELIIEVDPTVYSVEEIQQILAMVADGNRNTGGLSRCLTAYGIIGFVRFLQGYYMILVVKRDIVARFGPHIVHSVASTAFIPIPHPSVHEPPEDTEKNLFRRLFHKSEEEKFYARVKSDENRYRNVFNIVDLTRNFYYSYTLDITRTLQYLCVNSAETSRPKSMYIWNDYLMKPFRKAVNDDRWTVNLVHGFFLQRRCNSYGRRITLTLIARRSRYFAGTRYRKRGVNDKGHVANDVETEQVVNEGKRYTSYVQLRASIPLFWTQESSAIVPKPAIVVQKVDPMHLTTRLHFQDLFARYGSPILAVNLVKQKEKIPREMLIGGRFGEAVRLINTFLPPHHRIDYVAWDFKKVSKSKIASVVDKLGIISRWAMRRTGLFASHPSANAIQVTAKSTVNVKPKYLHEPSIVDTESLEPRFWATQDFAVRQCGVMRSNCIDSLDRTNVSQFCLGKEALSRQLFSLQLITNCNSSTVGSSKIIKILLDMYEAMGDAIAIQYGGSQMHRKLKSDAAPAQTVPALHRRKKPGKGREMLVSFMRHYRNAFQDHDKQDAFNLFLGLFAPAIPLPHKQQINIWDLSSDYFLHNSTMGSQALMKRSYELGALAYANPDWYRSPISHFLHANGLRPRRLSLESHEQAPPCMLSLLPPPSSAPSADAFDRMYDTHVLSFFDELLSPNSLEYSEPLELIVTHRHANDNFRRRRLAIKKITGGARPLLAQQSLSDTTGGVGVLRLRSTDSDDSSMTVNRRDTRVSSIYPLDELTSSDEDDDDDDDDAGSEANPANPLSPVVAPYKSIQTWFASDAAKPRGRLPWDRSGTVVSPLTIQSPQSDLEADHNMMPTLQQYAGHVVGSSTMPTPRSRLYLRCVSHMHHDGGDDDDVDVDVTMDLPREKRCVRIVIGDFPSVSGRVPIYCFGTSVSLPDVFSQHTQSSTVSAIHALPPSPVDDPRFIHIYHDLAYSNNLACDADLLQPDPERRPLMKRYATSVYHLDDMIVRAFTHHHDGDSSRRSIQSKLMNSSLSMPDFDHALTVRLNNDGHIVANNPRRLSRPRGHSHTHSEIPPTIVSRPSILDWVSPRKLFARQAKTATRLLDPHAADHEKPLNLYLRTLGIDCAHASEQNHVKRAELRRLHVGDDIHDDRSDVLFESPSTVDANASDARWYDGPEFRRHIDVYTRYVQLPQYFITDAGSSMRDSFCLDVCLENRSVDESLNWLPRHLQFPHRRGNDGDDRHTPHMDQHDDDDDMRVSGLHHKQRDEDVGWTHNLRAECVGVDAFVDTQREYVERARMRLKREKDVAKFANMGLHEYEWVYCDDDAQHLAADDDDSDDSSFLSSDDSDGDDTVTVTRTTHHAHDTTVTTTTTVKTLSKIIPHAPMTVQLDDTSQHVWNMYLHFNTLVSSSS